MIRKAEYYKASGKAGQKRWRAYALSLVIILVIAFVLQFIFRQLFFYPLKISSDSMLPEIQSGDKRYFIHPKLTTVAVGDVVLVRTAAADGRIRLLSIDVFDTLVWRRVPEPADVFLMLGLALAAGGKLAEDVSPAAFAELRRG